MRLLVTLLCIMFFTTSCHRQNADLSEGSQTTKVDYKAEGYTAATVVWDKTAQTPCDYLIHTKDGQVLEAMDLSEDAKIDGQRIWLKFMQQRRMSQCGETQPIGIQAIVIR